MEQCCRRCFEVKPIAMYYKDRTRSNGYDRVCKSCSNKLREARRLGNKNGIERHLYDTSVVAQNNKCAICKDPPKEGTSLFIDHDHKTGRFRGLLCNRCNSGLGFWRDNVALMLRAIEYVGDSTVGES